MSSMLNMKSLLFVLFWIPNLTATTEKGIIASHINIASVINNLFNNILRLEREMESTKSKLTENNKELASTKSKLEATDKELASLRTSVNTNGADVRSRFNTLEERTQNLENMNRSNIAFQVQLKRRSVTLGRNEVLKFDRVTLNTGDAYNPRSGIFIVPVSGTYFFWGNIMSNDKGYFAILLKREGSVLTRGYTTYVHHLGVASMTYMAKLRKGEHIWFENDPPSSSNSNIYGIGYSNYGGALMFL